MKIEIDQSGRVEETNRPTALAYTNGKTGSILIHARTKRRLQEIFRQIGQPRTFFIYIFTVLIYLLIVDKIEKISEINIDTEYLGYEKVIRKLLAQMLGNKYSPERLSIEFSQVGRKSMAHRIAITVHRGFKKADIAVTYEKMIKICFKNKNGYPTLKYQVTMDKR